MKWVIITILALIAVLDVLLILGCAKLEKMREERDSIEQWSTKKE